MTIRGLSCSLLLHKERIQSFINFASACHGTLQEQLRLKSRAERFKDQLSNAPLAKAASKGKPSTAAAAEFEAKKKVCLCMKEVVYVSSPQMDDNLCFHAICFLLLQARAERFKVAL